MFPEKAPDMQVVLENSNDRFPTQIAGAHSPASASAFSEEIANAYSELSADAH